jgi:hypothetical protein
MAHASPRQRLALFLAALSIPASLVAQEKPTGSGGASGIVSGVTGGLVNGAGGVAGGAANNAISGALGGGIVGSVVGSTAGAAIGGAVSDTVGSAVSGVIGGVAGDTLGSVTGGLLGGGTRIVNGNSIGSLASPSNVANAATKVSDSVMTAGEAIEAALNQQAAATTKLADTQNIVMQTLAQQQALVQQAAIIDQNYGATAAAPSGCATLSQSSAYASGKSSAVSGVGDVVKKLQNWSGSGGISRDEGRKKIDEMPDDGTLVNALIPPPGSFGVTDKDKAMEYIQAVTDAMPEPGLAKSSQGLEKTRAGKEHERIRKLRAESVALPNRVLAGVLENNLATIDYGTWSQGLQAQGGSAPSGGGKVSIIAAMQALSDSRISNPQWVKDLHAMNDVGVAREIAIIEASRMEIEVRQLKLLNDIATLIALQSAHSAQRAYTDALTSTYNAAVAEKGGGVSGGPAAASGSGTP